MSAVLVNLPDQLKRESTKVAKHLGVSRTEFIKQAIIHELEHFKKRTEEEKIASSFKAMKKSKAYIAESNELIDDLSESLPEEGAWWKKQ